MRPASARLDGGAHAAECNVLLAGYRDSRPVRVGNATSGQLQLDTNGELLQTARLRDKGLVAEPYSQGNAGKLMRAARALTAAGAAGAALGRRSRIASAAAGVALVAGSAALRFAVFEAGLQSARDPKYMAIPSAGGSKSGPAKRCWQTRKGRPHVLALPR